MRARRFDGPWGQVVVLATDTRVDVPVLEGVWLADPKTSFEFTPTPWGWQAIDLAPWGPGALVCFARSELRVLDLGANTLGEPLRLDVPLDPTTIAVAPDQRRAVVGFGHTGRGEQRGALRLFELVEGALRPSDWQPEVRFPVKTALFVAPQRLLVAGGRDTKGAEFGQGELVLYDLEARRSLMTIPSPVASFTLLRAQPHTQRVLVVNELGELHLIDLERLDEDPWDQPLRDESPAVEGLPGRRAHAHEIWDAQFSPDGARLYTVAGRSNRAGTGELKVWDLEGMELLDERLRYGPVLRSIVLHPEGLLTTAEDEEARARVLELWPIGPP